MKFCNGTEKSHSEIGVTQKYQSSQKSGTLVDICLLVREAVTWEENTIFLVSSVSLESVHPVEPTLKPTSGSESLCKTEMKHEV